ncbi:hypothetical protein GWI33_021315 [Rhynchophorus ferrugineus]|uniref:Uncharacterized protein n=1 Tax=Rhynchophorus ferrugineus TaxID=354439 RepID=A0A834I1N8_RHYFE|nr:hypothetical protein GWI33_021315 [Rhynchophorus ferrugineus]
MRADKTGNKHTPHQLYIEVASRRACVRASDTVFSSDFQAFQPIQSGRNSKRERFHETLRSGIDSQDVACTHDFHCAVGGDREREDEFSAYHSSGTTDKIGTRPSSRTGSSCIFFPALKLIRRVSV